ncbi:chromosome partitioning protein ParA [Pseudomonas simiae]|nr:chromosome partitioning protein ParA [Pseudomonas simiae]
MPAREELKNQVKVLREQLDSDPLMSAEKRNELETLIAELEVQEPLEGAIQDPSIADGVNLAVERFELDHPGIAGTLRNIVTTLGNIGI